MVRIARALTRFLPPHAFHWAVLALATLAVGLQPAQAAVTEAWVHRFSNVVSNATDRAVKVVRDTAGDIIVTGTTAGGLPGQDLLTIKYSGADGSVLWQQRYNGPANGDDRASALAVDGSGNVVVTGSSERESGSFEHEYYTAKYAAADGALLWEKRYSGPRNWEDSASAMALDGSGNVVVTGSSYNTNNTSPDYYTAKYAAVDGVLLWEKRYNGPANNRDQAQAVAVDSNDNVVVTGTSYSTNSNDDYYTAKYAAVNGALLWEKRYNGPANSYDSATTMALDSSGNVVVAGSSPNGSSNYNDYYTAKYAAADGELLWEQRYNGPTNDYDEAQAVAVDGGGNVVVTGFSNAKVIQGVGIVGGGYYTAKYAAADGALLWDQGYNGSAPNYASAQAVAVDGSGNVVVTGFSYNSSGYADYYTAKYAAADGALLWEKRYDGPANSFDVALAVAVDGSGNVVVTGNSYNGNGNSDYYTAKYAAADGALLWEKRYNGAANSIDQARAVAVDGSGNFVVTGSSYITNYTSPDYYTAKYAAADGALLWEKRFNGPGSVGDSSHCLALSSDGMVAVTGTFKDGYATVAYREVLPAVSIDLIPPGVRLRFTGIPGRGYTIERAPVVTGPWNTIKTQTAPASGLLEYLDANPPVGAAFYRTREP